MSDTTDADMPEVISTDRVPLANRYAGAWFEYNNRVMARHNLTTMYISAATILIGFLYSITDKPLPEDKTARDSVRPIIMATTFALPGISIIYAAFMFMHDGIMSGLHHYMVYCERIGNDGRGALPSYHLDDIWNRNFFKYRWIQNAIGVALSIIFSSLAFVRTESYMPISASTIIAFLFVALCAIYLNISSFIIRRKRVQEAIDRLGRRDA